MARLVTTVVLFGPPDGLLEAALDRRGLVVHRSESLTTTGTVAPVLVVAPWSTPDAKELRDRWPSAGFVLRAPASESEAARTVARVLGADVLPVPLEGRKAEEALDDALRRARARSRSVALAEALRPRDSAAATELIALADERERLERELEEARRLRGAFLSNISHEIRTPVTVMQGMIDVVVEDTAERLDADQRDLLRRVRSSGDQLLELVQGILDLAKAESGLLESRPARVEVLALVRDVVSPFETRLRDRSIRLELDVPRHVGWITTDPTRLRQILSQLVSNAVKFTEAGEIAIRVRFAGNRSADPTDPAHLLRQPSEEGDLLEIEIRDTGVGIDPEQCERVFEAFHQADLSTARRFEGIGIGLSVVREAARLLGATVELESAVGKGTRVVVRLPVLGIGRRADPTREDARSAPSRAVHGEALDPLTAVAALVLTAPSRADEAGALAIDALARILAPTGAFHAESSAQGLRILDSTGSGLAPGLEAPLPPDVVSSLAHERRPLRHGDWLVSGLRGLDGALAGVLAVRKKETSDEDAKWLQIVSRWLGLVAGLRGSEFTAAEAAAHVVREIKEPLGSAMGYSQVLLRGLRGALTGEQRSVALRLEQAIHGAIHAALDLMDLERFRSGDLVPERKPYALDAVLDHVVSRLGATIEVGPFEIDRTGAPSLPHALGDEIRTDRALSAVLRGCFRGAPPRSRIALRTGLEGGTLTVEIEAPVGDPTAGVEGLRATPRPDESLSLSIAARWLEAQGARIDARRSGTGLRIRIEIPAETPETA